MTYIGYSGKPIREAVVGDIGSYLFGYDPVFSVATRIMIPEPVAVAILTSLKLPKPCNKDFICIAATYDRKSFIYYHDFQWWLCIGYPKED